MKHNYLALQRYSLLFAILLISLSHAFAQNNAKFEEGRFRIKVSDELATQLENLQPRRDANNVLLTGIASIDNIGRQYKVSGIKRVFRPAGKFEARHRKYGLHRWYEIEMDKASPVLQALSAYGSINAVELAEPVYKKTIIGYEKENANVSRNNALTKSSFTLPPPATLPGASNDPLLPNQWHYNNTGQTGGTPGADIRLIQAWGIETGSSDVIIAVTDGGIQVNHPDISANMWVNTGEIPGNNIDDDGNGYVDDINGYGFGDDTGFIAPDAHGTHVGGTIAATTNNGLGVAGVAGGSGAGDGARLMSCAAFGATNNGGFAESYTYGADNGAVISQNSWGYQNPNVFEQAVLDGIDYFIAEAGKDEFGNQVGPMSGGIVIFAAGNDDTNENWYPGFYEPTLSVAATTHEDKKSYYSNFGPWVDIAAPGGETINVTQQGILSTITPGAYAFFQGTSMACPHVSGTAALVVSKYGGTGFTPEILRARLVQTTDDIDALNPEFAGLLGSGRLNAFAALQENDNAPPDAITNLVASAADMTSVTLTWTAPSDPGNGSATLYDIRYSLAPITEDNFDEAIQLVSPPLPQPAGSTETVTINGLTPGTTYYFAVKSADFFGNFSAISNVVEQTTNFPPVIVVSPSSLNEDLEVAETSVQLLTITNEGQGPLEFSIERQENWATPSPAAGTVAPGGAVQVQVTFDANGLLWDTTYGQEFSVVSNDPADSVVIIAVTLSVSPNEAPIASVAPDSLGFGEVFIGETVQQEVTIHNGGSEMLVINASLDNPDFTSDLSSDTVQIASFSDFTIQVSYTPSVVGPTAGTFIIYTNDPARQQIHIPLAGEGVEAPDITVSPDSLFASLNTGNTSTQMLSIANNGGSDLEFSISVSAPVSSLSSVKEVNLPAADGVVKSSFMQKQMMSSAIQSAKTVTIKSVGTSAVSTKVLILTPDDDVSDLLSILNSFDDIEADVFPGEALPGVTLADLTGYDVVMTTNNGQWLAAGNIDPATVGDLLADYIDQGGKVIANEFAYSYDAWKMEGRFIDDQYGPFTPATTDEDITTSLGAIIAPGHPIVQGVSSLQYSGFVQNVGLAPGATALANWANGELFIAANSNVVALNLLPSLGNGGGFTWSGDLPTIYQNAIHWLAGPAFINVIPAEGTVSPGSQVGIEVTFDATGLEQGIYTASVDISTNVPGNGLVSVPALLEVLGPEFTVEPDSLYEEVEKGETSSRTLILTNNGASDHSFDVSVRTNTLNKGPVPSISVSRKPLAVKVKNETAVTKRTTASTSIVSLEGKNALINPRANAAKKQGAVPLATTFLYATDFEDFSTGDITDQEGWFGQFGNWTIEEENALSGTKHFRGLADGLGQSLAFSPAVSIGSEPKSTATMKIDLTGSNVTWQIIPQSTSAGSVNTRIQFSPDGSVQAMIFDGSGPVFADIPASVPSGYFNLTIEVDRTTAVFVVYFNDQQVFTGQGFAGDIEEVVILSAMEVAGPTLDIDDFQILDGAREFADPFVSVSPDSGILGAGQSVEITVTFDATELEFGIYSTDILIDIAGEAQLEVPTLLNVVGDPAIEVSPTVLQAVVYYKEDTVKNFQITNTGGRPLDYNMTVIGADVVVNSLPAGKTAKRLEAESDNRIQKKVAEDKRLSVNMSKEVPALQVLTGTSLMEEHFEGASFPPAGWNVVDNENSGLVWDFAAAHGDGNYCGTGEAATANSDAFGTAEFDTELWTPVINTAGLKNIALQFNANYQNFANLDFLDVDILVEGHTTWQNVLRWNEDHGSLFGAGVSVTVELDEYLDDAGSFRLRWHYYDPNTDDWDWYAQIDDVTILGDVNTWLTVSPASGTIPVGSFADISAHFEAEDLEAGFYVAGILVSSNAVTNPLVGVVASMRVLEPAEISVHPDSIYQELMIGESATQTVTISNNGVSPLRFSISDEERGKVPEQSKERRAPTQSRTSPVVSTMRLEDRAAIRPSVVQTAGTTLYTTDFEEFAPGDINNQLGWAGQFANWTIESDNPFSGAQHFRGLSDGLGQSLAFSPEVISGSDRISSTTMMINADNAATATWQIIPQSISSSLVNTRLEFSPGGTLRALVQDSLGGAFYQNIPSAIPSGYFELRIDIERATSVFTIYFNGAAIFTGQGFAGDIEQVVILSLMETSGPTFDIDNLSIIDGEPVAPWLVVNPETGVVPAGSSMEVSLTFNTADLEEGTYTKVLNILNNDPATPVVSVPVTLNAMDNDPPVLADISDVTVAETGSAEVTFTATDEDDSVLTVTLVDHPSFISQVSSGNGTVTYSINPGLGDAGDYHISVLARDERGEADSALFHLTVVPYGIADFSLLNAETGALILDFSDSVTIDVADPDFLKYSIRANAVPKKVGSVQFRINGKKINLDNQDPYILNRLVLPLLGKGSHRLKAEAFTESGGRGQKGKSAEAFINIINSATVTSFTVVNRQGNELMSLEEGGVIDTRQPGYGHITIVAGTNGSRGVGSIRFELNGRHYHTDNLSPYSLTGDLFGYFLPWPARPGHYTLKATPYSLPLGLGIPGQSLTINFEVVRGTTVASARGEGSSNERISLQEEITDGSETKSLILYPMPVNDKLSVRLTGEHKGEVEMIIHNIQGQLVYKGRVSAEKLHDTYELSTRDLSLGNGVYFLQTISSDGERKVEKFVKE